jgi:hypothetical protein
MEKYCQSCGMPLNEENLFGTEKDGSRNEDYCVYCYKEGSFTSPDVTMQQMIDICVPHMVEAGMKEDESRVMLNDVLPKLKRWNTGA